MPIKDDHTALRASSAKEGAAPAICEGGIVVKTFSDAEIVAIAGAFRPKEIETAKSSLKDGANEQIDVTLRIRGTVQKAPGSPASTVQVAQTVSLANPNTFHAVLRALGIGAKRLRTAVEGLDLGAITEDKEFSAIFQHEAERRAMNLPTIPRTNPAKAGAVTVTASVEPLE